MGRPIKHYGKYRIRWVGPTGTRKSEVYTTYRDAAHALRRYEIEAEEIRSGRRAPALACRTFDQLADEWMRVRAAKKRSKRDDACRLRRHLVPAFGGLTLQQVTTARIESYAAASAASPALMHHILTLLASMLNYAVSLGWLDRKPHIRKPTLPKLGHDYNYLRTQDEIRRFLRAAEQEGELVLVLYTSAIYTGMRLGELAGLRWEDVHLDTRQITVQRSYAGPTKAGYARYVPILDPLLPVLQAWQLRSDGPLVFPNRKGNMRDAQSRVFDEALRRVLTRAGLPEVEHRGKRRSYITFHGLRDTFASHWMMSGGDMFRLQRIGGWQSAEMVQRLGLRRKLLIAV